MVLVEVVWSIKRRGRGAALVGELKTSVSVLVCEEGKGERDAASLISRKVPVAKAFEDSRASLRQANQERSSGVVKRDRLSSINIEGRAVDKVVPESGLVALGRTPLSP